MAVAAQNGECISGSSGWLMRYAGRWRSVRANGAMFVAVLLSSCMRVGYQPPADGGADDSYPADLRDEVLVLHVEPEFVVFADWNAYLKRTDPSQPCDGTEYGGYAACIHGGERRRVKVPGQDSCSGLVLHEELGLFEWACDDADGVVFSTTGLRSSSGLSQLLNVDGFRENRVVIERGSADKVVGRSQTMVWGWNNPVKPLPLSRGAAVVVLDEPGTIYTLERSEAGSGYNVDANRIAVVTLGNAVLSYDGTTDMSCNAQTGEVVAANEHCLISAGSQSFLWMEVRLDGGDDVSAMAERGIVWNNVTFARIHRTLVRDTASVGIALRSDSNNNFISDVTIQNVGSHGLFVNGNDNRFHDLTIEQVGGSGLNTTLWAERNRFSDLRVTGISGLDQPALALRGSDNSYVNLLVHKSEAYGVLIIGSRTSVVNAVLTNHRYGGFRLWSDEPREGNIVVGVLATHNGGGGGYLQAGKGTTVSHVTAANNGIYGVRSGVTGSLNERSTLNQIAMVNNREYGLHIVGADGSDAHVFSRILAAHNHVSNVFLQTGDAHRFVGDLWVSEPENNCRVRSTSPAPGLIDGTCTDSGKHQSSSYAGQASTALLHIGVDMRNTFVGKVMQEDRTNSDDRAGAAEASEVTDFLRFDNRWRGWGAEGGVFPDPAQAGRCLTNTCRIWDWQVREEDTAIRAINGDFVPGGICPAAVSGDEAITDSQNPPHTFLINAVEIVLDGIGNDNGLCESGERCIFSPGIGAYLGGGALWDEPCIFQHGRVSGVTMYGYSKKGFSGPE